MSEFVDILNNPAFWVAVLRIATPLILGTLGVLLCERAGVLNLGIEGIMVAGAFTGWLAVYLGAGLWGGVLVAALTGAALGLLHAFLTVVLALSQHVSGLGIGASIKAKINARGQITGVEIISPGYGYTDETYLSVRSYSALVHADLQSTYCAKHDGEFAKRDWRSSTCWPACCR